MKCRYAKYGARTTAVFSRKFKCVLFFSQHTSFSAVRSHFISYRCCILFAIKRWLIAQKKKQYHYSFILLVDWFRWSCCLLPLWHRLALHLNSFCDSNHDFNSYIGCWCVRYGRIARTLFSPLTKVRHWTSHLAIMIYDFNCTNRIE